MENKNQLQSYALRDESLKVFSANIKYFSPWIRININILMIYLKVIIHFNESYYTKLFKIYFFHLILYCKHLFSKRTFFFKIINNPEWCSLYLYSYISIFLGLIHRNRIGGSKSMHILNLTFPFSNYSL